MFLFLLVIVLAVLLGYVFGGKVSRFEGLGLRWWGLALFGLAIQFVPLPEGQAGTDLLVRTVVLSISYASLVGFALLNVKVAGMALVMAGLICNFVVIAANGGMPVSAEALRASDQPEVLASLTGEGSDKHHLLTDDDVLTFLADVIAVPAPFHQAISVGDIFIYGGLIWLTVGVMLGRSPSPSSSAVGPYRGKHRRGAPGPVPAP